MINTKTIKVTNNFKRGHRRIIVYNNSNGEDYIIPWEENNIKEFEIPEPGNFLLLAITPGPGDLDKCRIDLPDNRDFRFTFIPSGIENITVAPANSTVLRIPAGTPSWRLIIINATDSPEQQHPQMISYVSRDSGTKDPTNVTVGDDPPE